MNENLIVVDRRLPALLTAGALRAALEGVPDAALVTVIHDDADCGQVEAPCETLVTVEPRRVRRSEPKSPIGFQWVEAAEVAVTLATAEGWV